MKFETIFEITYEKCKSDQIFETKIQKVMIFEILKLEIEFFCNESNYAW